MKPQSGTQPTLFTEAPETVEKTCGLSLDEIKTPNPALGSSNLGPGSNKDEEDLSMGKCQESFYKESVMPSSDSSMKSNDWSVPLPLTAELRILQEFPVEVFPPWLSDMVSEVATSTQTPLDLAGSIALGVLALANSGKIKIEVSSDWKEALNVFIAVALPSGARKSSVFSALTSPLEDWETGEQDKWSRKAAKGTIKRDILAKRLELLMKSAITGDTIAESKAADLSDTLMEMEIPVLPRIIASDVTPEAVVRLLSEQNGRIGIFSSEGGELISIMGGRYSKNGRSNLEVFLKAHTGERITVDRSDRSREPITIKDPALRIMLCLQPSVLKSAWQHRDFKDRGLTGRFLWVLPEDLMGRRKIDVPCVSPEVKVSYNSHIQRLLDGPWDGPITLKLSSNAMERLSDFRRKHEPKLGPEGQYREMKGWASKLPGSIVRFAGLLHIANFATSPEFLKEPISEKIMAQAIRLGDYYSAEVEKIQILYGESEETQIASRILNVISVNQLQSFSERDMYRTLGLKKDEITGPLALLKETFHIRRAPIHPHDPTKKSGRNSSPIWEVNPLLLSGSDNSVKEKTYVRKI